VKRSKADAELTRAALLKAALKVFTAKGYTRATLDEIARAARVTRGAVYHHFTDKAEIYQTLLLESSRKSKDLIPAAIAEGGSFLEIIERVFVRQLTQMETDPDLRAQALFALRGDYGSIDSVREEIARRHMQTLALLTQTFAEAQAGGVVRTDLAPRDIARAFIALQNGLVHLTSLPGQQHSITESAAALAKVLLAGIQQPS
jgi:AcrR family transcriptional regulator